MRILAIHGVGHGDAKTDWPPQWQQAVFEGLSALRPGMEPPAIEFLTASSDDDPGHAQRHQLRHGQSVRALSLSSMPTMTAP